MVSESDIPDRAWARVKQRTPIPDPLRTATLLALSDGELAMLLRDNLLPQEGPAARRAHADLWTYLEESAELTERALDVLEAFEDQAETDGRNPGLGEPQRKRIGVFSQRVDDMARRLERGERRHHDGGEVKWIGREYRNVKGFARQTIRQLARAIDTHRSEIAAGEDHGEADRRLWALLAQMNLDPQRPTDTDRDQSVLGQ